MAARASTFARAAFGQSKTTQTQAGLRTHGSCLGGSCEFEIAEGSPCNAPPRLHADRTAPVLTLAAACIMIARGLSSSRPLASSRARNAITVALQGPDSEPASTRRRRLTRPCLELRFVPKGLRQSAHEGLSQRRFASMRTFERLGQKHLNFAQAGCRGRGHALPACASAAPAPGEERIESESAEQTEYEKWHNQPHQDQGIHNPRDGVNGWRRVCHCTS